MSRFRSPPSIWISAIELTPMLKPNVPMLQSRPVKPDTGKIGVVQEVEARLEQDVAGRDRFRVFGDERTRLRPARACPRRARPAHATMPITSLFT